MNNIKLIKASLRGWYVEIDNGISIYKTAFTNLELQTLGKIIKDNMDEIMKEIDK